MKKLRGYQTFSEIELTVVDVERASERNHGGLVLSVL
jgi:hypothetical protein